jgi:maleamate amidohydrolase
MTEQRIWDRFLTDRDRAVLGAAGFGARAGFGKRPALIIVDVTWAFCGDRPEPILESIKRWPISCGAEAWTAIEQIKRLADCARQKGLPVIYTTYALRPDNWEFLPYAWKRSRSDSESVVTAPDRDRYAIVDPVAPVPRDIIVYKQRPSAFFGTNLASYLNLLACDSLVVAGTTTSGCVRATAVDAFSLNYRVTIAEEACFDRGEANHAVTLFDLHAKYADVVGAAEIVDYFKGLPAGLFDLPKGSP